MLLWPPASLPLSRQGQLTYMHQKALALIWAGDSTLSRAELLSGSGVPGGQVSGRQGGPCWVETER